MTARDSLEALADRVRDRVRATTRIDELDTETLAEAFAHADPSVRRDAVRLVAASPVAPRVLLLLESSLRDANLARRSTAMDALAALGTSALPLLGRLARDPNAAVRRLAVDALGMTKSPAALDALAICVRDDKPAVRAAALEAIAKCGGERAAQLLLRTVDDRAESGAVVLAALLGLLELGETPTANAVRARVADPLTAAPALRLLARLGDYEPVVDALTEGTGSRQRAAALGLLDAFEGPSQRSSAATGAADNRREANSQHGLGGTSGRGRWGELPPSTRAQLVSLLRAPRAVLVLRTLVGAGDVHVACAALIVSAHAKAVDVLAQAVARDDLAHITSAAHRAARVLAPQVTDLAARLRVLAADDGPGADVLREIAASFQHQQHKGPAAPPVGGADAFRSVPRTLSTDPVSSLSDETFARLQQVFERVAGLMVLEDARVRVVARLWPRVNESGSGTLERYLDRISAGDDAGREEMARALDLVTVHETYFFREREQIEAFAQDVLPDLVTQHARTPVADGAPRSGQDDVFRVWSAGCASGEEAYTLSILLHDAGVRPHRVIGTDISAAVIAHAKQGVYGSRSFRVSVDDAVRRRWFLHQQGTVQVHPDLRSTTSFQVLNLMDTAACEALPLFDAIFCRNVLIYLALPARRQLMGTFFRQLRPGGVLLLGHSESLLSLDTPFGLRPMSHGLAYARPLVGTGTIAAKVLSPPPAPPRGRPK